LAVLQKRQHHDLYALLAYTDSARTGQIYWNPNGEHFAHLYLSLPFFCGLGSMLISLVAGSWELRRAGLSKVLGYWLFGVVCATGFAAVVAWLWVNAIGVFI
jgi:hypothetical protein